MLYDEIIVPDFDLPCQFSPLQDIANIEIMEPDDFITYSDSEKILPRLDKEYASYIKPTIVDWLAKNAATFYNYRDEEISTKRYFGDLYDGFYKISDKYKELDHIWEMNAKRFHIFQKAKMTEPDLVPDDYREFYLVNIMSLIANIVNELIWNLETSIQRDSAIMGSDMMLKGEKRKVNLYSAYQILKVEHNKLLTMLPSFGSLTEVIKFRESKRADIKRLPMVLLELENILRTDGRNAAILKAEADIVKANEELMRNTKIEKVLRWTTYLSLPIGIAELILNGSFAGLSISGAGFLAQMKSDVNIRKNNWLNVVR